MSRWEDAYEGSLSYRAVYAATDTVPTLAAVEGISELSIS